MYFLSAAYLPYDAHQACGAPRVGIRSDAKARPYGHQQAHKETSWGKWLQECEEWVLADPLFFPECSAFSQESGGVHENGPLAGRNNLADT